MSEPLPLFINKHALEKIKEYSRAAPPGLETGGILIGTEMDGKKVVFFATGPGEKAIQKTFMFSSDVKRTQRIIDKYYNEYGCNYLGVWHKHPPEFERLSAGDLRQANEILKDESYHVTELILPIVNIVNGELRLRVFRFNGGEPTQTEWTVVEHDSDLINQIKTRASANKKKKIKLDEVQWYQTSAGKDRLVREKTALDKHGLKHETFTYPSDEGDLLGFRIFLNPLNEKLPPNTNVIFITPKGYPRKPPMVALELKDELEEIKVAKWEDNYVMGSVIDEFISFVFDKVLGAEGGNDGGGS